MRIFAAFILFLKYKIFSVYVQLFSGNGIRSASIYGSDSKHKVSDRIKVYVVSAKEINPPENTEAIDWTLLTNIPVNNMNDAIERINWYKLRWKIEEYFRVLKSGCNTISTK
jgi:hypothetical protein